MKKSGNKKTTPKVAVIVTVFNEAETIDTLLSSLSSQTLPADEVIVVDGGSTDSTWEKMQAFSQSHPDFPLKIFRKKGNRSVGRNYAISQANSKQIAITDAGCIPEENWLDELVAAQKLSGAEVVAGYYRGLAKTPLEQAIIPYALVMPDKLNPDNFLPATRSMLIEKNTFEEFGGFDEKLNDNEDYAFAIQLKKAGKKIVFAQKAVVAWQPRSNLSDFFQMVFRFARGDIFAGIIRPKVMLIYLRYLVFLILPIWLFAPFFTLYLIWSILKNYRYAPEGWYWLPVLQLVSDIAVMSGSVAGFIQRAEKRQN